MPTTHTIYMTAEEFSAAGRTMFGPKWKKRMAFTLCRSGVTIWRWSKDGVPVKLAAAHITKLRNATTNHGDNQ